VTPRVVALLRAELARRGYRDTGASPYGSIVLDYEELAELDLGEILDLMVSRRERVVRSVDAIGKEKATQHFEDAEAAIQAIKDVIKKVSA
jgi:hypothetical protein